MLKSLKSFVLSASELTEKDKQREAEHRKKVKEICKRQEALQKQEVNQTWRVAMGNEIPKKKKESFLLDNITRRNVWMEPDFLFNKVKLQFPDEIFHPIDQYVLKWQPLGSNFQVLIPLNDSFLQENAIVVMSQLSPRQQKKVVFLFTTIDPSMNLFAPKVHPASLVSYHTKNEVLKKLSDFYLQGSIPTEEIQAILTCDVDVWKPALYNLLPADEQVFHTYLNEVKRDEKDDKPIQRSYLDGEISLQEFEDLKFPDRKKKRDIEAQDYPLPFEGQDCVICGKSKAGVINCHTCDNMVCVRCVKTVFHGLLLPPEGQESAVDIDQRAHSRHSHHHHSHRHSRRPSGAGVGDQVFLQSTDGSERLLSQHSPFRKVAESTKSNIGRPSTAASTASSVFHSAPHPHANPRPQFSSHKQSFLLMHHKYCLKLGALPDVQPEVHGEMACLREFRKHTKHAAMAMLLPPKETDDILYDPHLHIEETEEEREERRLEELRLQKLLELSELEKQRLAEENPLALQEKRALFEDRKRRYDRIKKEIFALNVKILDTSHTEQFIARNSRLRLEEIAKMHKSVTKPLNTLLMELHMMSLPGSFLSGLISEIELLLEELEAVCSIDISPDGNFIKSGTPLLSSSRNSSRPTSQAQSRRPTLG